MIKKHFVKTFIFCTSLLAGCTTSNTGGVPNLVSVSQVERMSATAWQEQISQHGISDDTLMTARFERIAWRLIAVSYLTEEDWDVRVFATQTPAVFAMAGHRLGASKIDALTDDRVAALAAYGIASVELQHTRQNLSRKVLGRIAGSVGGTLADGDNSEQARKARLLNAISMSPYYIPAPTQKMREEALARSKALVENAGLQLTFLTHFLQLENK